MSLLNDYKSSLKNVAVEEYADLFLFRPIAFIFVKLISKTEITPNQVTGMSLAVGALSGVFFAWGTNATVAIGGLLIAAATMLDCADGQLARLKNNGTPFGRILDGVVDYLYTISAFVGIALGSMRNGMSPFAWWVFVSAAGASYAIQAGMFDYYRNEFLTGILGKSNFVDDEVQLFTREYENLRGSKGRYIEKILLLVYLRYSSYQKRLEPKEKDPEKRPFAAQNGVPLFFVRLWSFNGTSTHILILVVSSFLGRPDFFLWYVLVFGSLYALLLWGVHAMIENGGGWTGRPRATTP